MGYRFTLWNIALIAALLLFLLGSAAVADVVGTSGTISNVPGHPGKKLKYRAGAIRSAPGKAHFWLQLKNEEAMDMSVVVCAMLNLKRDRKPDADFAIGKTLDEPPKWKCRPVADAPGDGGSAPNVHFGCKLVTVAAGTKIDVFDQVADFSKGAGEDFTDEELARLYFDLLKACEVTDCGQVKGGNKFLTPDVIGPDDPWVNVWAGGKRYEDLTSTGLSQMDWPNGNWITMRKDVPAVYPSRLIGVLAGAPAGATVQFFCTNDVGPRPIYQVQPDPGQPPCGGLNLHVNEVFQIGLQHDEESGFRLWMPPPSTTCGFVPEGGVVRFNGDVIAEPGAPHYDPGEYMYGVDTWLVRDTQQPTILSAEASQAGSRLHVEVAAEDATTMATGASLIYSVGGNPEIELPIDYAIPSSAGETMLFESFFDGLPFGVAIRYHVDVVDELGNRASSPPDSVVLDPGRVKGTPPSEFGLRVTGPNPFRAAEGISFEYGLPRAAAVSIAAFDAHGRRVATLVEGAAPAGRHTGFWRGLELERVEPGVYFLRMEAGAARLSVRLVLLK